MPIYARYGTYGPRRPQRNRRRTARRFGRYRRPIRRFRRRRTGGTVGFSKQNARVVSRRQMVKLPWSFNATFIIDPTSSQSFFFVGNGLIPNVTTPTPPPGSVWAAGATQYGSFYDKYRVDGSSFSLQITQQTANTMVDFVLLATPLTASIAGTVSELDSLSYEDLKSWQYATWRTLTGDSKASQFFIRKYRRTKNMLQVRDIRDQMDLLAELPLPDGSGGMSFPQGLNSATETGIRGWIYYMKFFNLTSTAATMNLGLRMIQYTTVQNQRIRIQDVVPE